jgi:hypothetical protein
VLSVVLLPDSAVVTVMLCSLSTGECLREAQIDQNGGGNTPTPIRVGSHAIDHAYSQLYAWYGTPAHRGSAQLSRSALLNVSIEYAVGPKDSSGSERQLDLVVTPVLTTSPGTSSSSGALLPGIGLSKAVDLSDYAVVFAGSFGWGRLGEVRCIPVVLCPPVTH